MHNSFKSFSTRLVQLTIIFCLVVFGLAAIAQEPAEGEGGTEGQKQYQDVNALDRLKDTAMGGYNVETDLTPEYASSGVIVVLGNYVMYFVSFLGVIFLILFIYSGWLWLTAGGNEEQVTKAKTIMKNAIIGLALVLSANVSLVLIDRLYFLKSSQ